MGIGGRGHGGRGAWLGVLLALLACGDDAGGAQGAGAGTGGSAAGAAGGAATAGSGGGAGTSGKSGGGGGGAGTQAMPRDAGDDPGASGASGADAGSAGSGGAQREPHPMLADLADETAIDLGAFECTAPSGEDEGGCRRVTDYSGLVHDDVNHGLLMFGGGHSTTMTDTVFAFDLDSALSWRELYPPTPCELMVESNLDPVLGAWEMGPEGPYPRPLSIHTYDLLAYAPETNELLLLGRLFTGGYCNSVGNDVGGTVAHFSLDTETWSFSPDAEATPSTAIPGSERDPMSGLMVVFGSDGLKLYDPVGKHYTDTLDTLNDVSGAVFDLTALGYAHHLVYFPPDDTFYFFQRGDPVEVVALHLDRDQPALSTVERIDTSGPTSPHSEPGYAYDSVNRVIGGGVAADTFYAFDPADATWSSHPINVSGGGDGPGDQAFHAIAYDPASNVFVFRAEYDSGQHTWAYRLRRAP
jgi:hypothetical protein